MGKRKRGEEMMGSGGGAKRCLLKSWMIMSQLH